MQQKIRVGLVVALAAATLGTASAQFQSRSIGPIEVTSIDAVAKTILVRTKTGMSPMVNPYDGVRGLAADGPEAVAISPSATVVRRERALPASALKVGDVVSLLEQRPEYPFPITKPITLFEVGGNIRRPVVENFRVVSLLPLTLQKGSADLSRRVAGQTEVQSLPFSTSATSTPIGDLSVTTLPNGEALNAGANSVTTLSLYKTKVEELEFDRITPMALTDVAAALAAGTVKVRPEFEFVASPDGTQLFRVKRLEVSNAQEEPLRGRILRPKK